MVTEASVEATPVTWRRQEEQEAPRRQEELEAGSREAQEAVLRQGEIFFIKLFKKLNIFWSKCLFRTIIIPF